MYQIRPETCLDGTFGFKIKFRIKKLNFDQNFQVQNVEPILNNYATMQTEDIDLDLLLLVDGGNDVDNWGNLALQGKVEI